MVTTVSKLLNTGVLQTGGDIDEFSLDSLNQGSVFFNGTNSYLTVPTSSFLTATNTYTIEMWIAPSAYPTSTNSAALYQVTNANVTNYGGLSVELYGTGNIRFQCRPSTGGTNVTITTLSIIPLNVWTHVVVVVNNGYATIYLNGVQSGTAIVTALDNTQTFCSVGYLNNGNVTSQTNYSGYMSNLRVTKGIAIYPDNAALTTTSGIGYNTSLLTAKSSSLVTDVSSTYPYVTNIGASSTNTNIPFAGTYSTVFNGTTQYITNSSTTISNFGTENFTFECWINSNTIGATQTIYDARPTYSEDYALTVFFDNSNHIQIYVAGAAIYSSSIVLFPSFWYHIAIVRSGIGTNQCSLYINGILDGSFTLSTNFVNAYNNIGSSSYTSGTNFFNGLISNLRIVKGTAIYSGASFTVPTTALTAISGTTLLTCQTSEPTDVLPSTSTTPYTNSLINPSTITTSNSVIPFAGTYSTLFDGSFQEIRSSSTTISNFGTSNFTFECWVYKTGGDYPYRVIYDGQSQDHSLANCFTVYYTFEAIRVAVNGVDLYSSSVSLTDNAWHHIAVVRSGTGSQQCALYIDGAMNGSFTCATSIANGYNVIGNNSTPAMDGGSNVTRYFGGYISNLRIVKGTAVYSGNPITVPTTALTNISGTSLLTCQSSSPTIDVTNNNTLVSIPSLVSSTSNSVIPFAGTYSAVFGNNFIKSPLYTTLGAPNGTNNFTIELWVRFNTIFATETHIFYAASSYINDATIIGPQLFINGGVLKYVASASNIVGTTTIATNTWYHIAIVKTSGTTNLYLNGNVEGTMSDSNTYENYAYIYFGFSRYQRYYAFDGYISNFRIVRGTAVYTSAFPSSVPTTALTAISGTSLLAFQSSSINTYTSNDNTAINAPNPVITSNSIIPFAGTYSILTGLATNYKYLSIPNHIGNQLTTGDFTIEFWMRPNALAAQGIFAKRAAAANFASVYVAMQATGKLNVAVSNAAGTAWSINDTTTMPTMAINTWYHVAIVRNGNNIQTYVNGVQYINSTAITSATVIFDSGVNFVIGANASTTLASGFNGYISNFRIVKGTAVYTYPVSTTNFTPVSTELYPIASTKLLTAKSSTVTDSSSTVTLTNAGSVTTTNSVIPFSSTYSYEFNGTSKYMTAPYTTANFDWWTTGSDFSIEAWIYPTTTTGWSYNAGGTDVPTLIQNGGYNNSTCYWAFGINPSRQVTFYYFNGTGVTITSTSTVTLNTWTHIAMVKTSSGITLFVGGVAQTQTAISGTPQSSVSYSLTIGAGNNAYINGYVSNLRIVRGMTAYATNPNFQVPLTPLTSISGTTLLVAQSASAIVDNTSNNTTYIGNVGTVTTSTSVVPFSGAYSNLFNGSSQYLSLPPSNFLPQINNTYTIEMWINPSAYPTSTNYCSLFQVSNSNVTNFGNLNLELYGTGTIRFEVKPNTGGTNVIVQTATIVPLNQWTHVAVNVDRGRATIYLNGIASAFGLVSSLDGTQVFSSIGRLNNGYVTSQTYYSGYISNARIVRGKAIYPNSFYVFDVPSTQLQTTQTSSTGIAAIPSASSVSLLLPLIQSTDDTSTYGLSITKSGYVAPSTLNRFKPPFIDFNAANDGYNSYYFPGSTTGISHQTANSLDFGNGDFTFECWVYMQADNGRELTLDNINDWYNIIDVNVNSATNIGFKITADTFGVTHAAGYNNGSYISFVPSGSKYGNRYFQYNTWYHLAITRSGNIYRGFINGIEANYYYSSSVFINSQTYGGSIINIGYSNINLYRYSFCGYISNLRVVKNRILYTSNFTPPTSPLKLVTGTSLLTCQSPTIKDSTGRFLTSGFASGDNTTSIFDPFDDPRNITVSKQYSNGLLQTTNNIDEISLNTNLTNQGSIYFNGTAGIYTGTLSTTEVVNFDKNIDFTIEAWLYNSDSVNTNERYFFHATTPTSYAVGIKGGQHAFYDSTGTNFYTAGTAPLGRWYHYALVRKNNILQLFIDGVLLYYTPDTIATSASRSFIIGYGISTATSWKGYVSNFRIVKGIAVYSKSMSYLPKNITVPSTALTTTSSTLPTTSLLTAQSSTIIDNSGGNIIIANSNVTTTNSVIPFAGTYSYDFTTNTNKQLMIAPLPAFDLKSFNFTLECWIYISTYNGAESIILSKYGTSGASYQFKFNNSGKLIFNKNSAGTAYSVTATSTTIPLNSWTHIAYVRSGGIIYLYVNGVRDTTTGTDSNFSIIDTYYNSAISPVSIGADPQGTYRFEGYMSNLRLVRGIAVYSGSSFTVPTSALSATTPTSNLTAILTAQSSTIVDNSTNSTVFNDATLDIPSITNSVIPFAGTYSIKFNGHNNGIWSYLNQSGSTAPFGTNDFTIESWVYFDNTRPLQLSNAGLDDGQVIVTGGDGANSLSIFMNADVVSIPHPGIGGGYTFTPVGGAVGTRYFQYNTWYHIALVRASGVQKLFINGVQATGSGTDTNYTFTTLNIGYSSAGGVGTTSFNTRYCFSGYLSNFRITMMAVYSSNFTPATSPLTTTSQGIITSSNVLLLTCQNSYFKDNSLSNSLIGVVPAQLKPFTWRSVIPFSDTYSNRFSGTNYFYAPASSDWAFGTGDFTVEAWVYMTSTNAAQGLFGPWLDGGTSSNFLFTSGTQYSGTNLSFAISDGTTATFYERISSGGLDATNTWYHIVATRSSGTLRLFSNGKLIHSVAGVTTNISGTTKQFVVGGIVNSPPSATMASSFNGYVSNLRVVKGQVVPSYATSSTTNGATIFTPPTSPLTTTSQGVTASNVVLLTCQDSTFIDNGNGNSGSKYQITRFPSVTTTNSVIPFVGTNSYYFAGQTGQFLQTQASEALKFGTNDFSIECWAYPTTSGAIAPLVVINSPYNGPDGQNAGQTIRISAGLGIRITDINSILDVTYGAYNSTSIPQNTWSHISLIRKDNIIKLYYNGLCVLTVPHNASMFDFGKTMITNPSTYYTSTTPCLKLGYDSNDSASGIFQGYISNVRIVNGSSVYDVSYSGGNFASPTSALTLTQSSGTNIAAIANNETSFLLNSGLNGFDDLSPNKIWLQKYGTLAAGYPLSSFQSPFASVPSTSYYSGKFNGSSNYLNVSGATMGAYGTGDFTIEFFMYPNSIATNQNVYNGTSSNGSDIAPWIQLSSANFRYGVGGSATITGTIARIPYRWYHVAVVRISNVTRMYVDGVQDGPVYVDNNNFAAITDSPRIGQNRANGIGFIDGYVSNLRVVQGVGVYKGPFLPLTAPLELTQSANGNIGAITSGQTKLLLFKTSTVTQDSAGINTLVNTNSVTSVNATEPKLLLFPPSTAQTISANTTLMKQYKTGELKVLNYVDEYNIRQLSIIPDSLSFNEGNIVNFNISYPEFGSGTLYWTNSGTTIGSDFSDSSNSGSVTITNGLGTITRTLSNDQIVEGTETLIIQLRTGSTSGPIIATSATITINDTSVPTVWSIVPIATSSGATTFTQYKFFNNITNNIDYTCNSGFGGTFSSRVGVMAFGGTFILEWQGRGTSTYYITNFKTGTQISTGTFANVGTGSSRNFDVVKFQNDKFGILYTSGTGLYMDTYSINLTTGAIASITTILFGTLTATTGFEGGDDSPQGAASVSFDASTMAVNSYNGFIAFSAASSGSPNYYGVFGIATINAAGTSGVSYVISNNTSNYTRPQAVSGATGKIYVSQFDGSVMRIANASGGFDTTAVSGVGTQNYARVPAPIFGTDNFMDVQHNTTTLQTKLITNTGTITDSTAFTTSFSTASSNWFPCIMQGAPNGCIFFYNDASSIVRYSKYNGSTWSTPDTPGNMSGSTLTINYLHSVYKVVNW